MKKEDIFIQKQLAKLADSLEINRDAFVKETSDTLSTLSPEQAHKIVDFLCNPENHQIGNNVLEEGVLRVNIDWHPLKELKDIYPEVHHVFHDIHIPTFKEGMFLYSANTPLAVFKPFDEDRDIGFYKNGVDKPTLPVTIEANHWLCVPVNEFHGPLYGDFADDDDVFIDDGKKYVVKICCKIKA